MNKQILVVTVGAIVLNLGVLPAGAAEAPGIGTYVFLEGTRIQKLAKQEGIDGRDVAALQAWLTSERFLGANPAGFPRMLLESAHTIFEDWDEAKNYLKECAAAFKERTEWYENHLGDIPDSFGKIIDWGPREDGVGTTPLGVEKRRWVGTVKVCSWVGNDEYYVEMNFIENGLLLHERQKSGDPFPETLDMANLPDGSELDHWMDVNLFKYKLHAKSNGMQFGTVMLNGAPAPNEFTITKESCFDIFLGHPPGDELPANQFSYCMGRCDPRYLNTGR